MRFVNQSTVYRIFSCWREILEACVNEFPLWPDKISDQEDMPAAFQNLYADARVIIDAAEIEIHRPSNPDTQSLTWSEYKSRNTAKFLLTVTPNGVPCFVSQCFGGRISGRELVQRSGFWGKTDVGQERFEAGDAIMAVKGFDIGELLKSRKLKLNHPPYLRDKKKFSNDEVVGTRRIASLRTHVERAIGGKLIKNFQALHHLSINICVVASRLVQVFAFLTTLMPPLVPPVESSDNLLEL